MKVPPRVPNKGKKKGLRSSVNWVRVCSVLLEIIVQGKECRRDSIYGTYSVKRMIDAANAKELTPAKAKKLQEWIA